MPYTAPEVQAAILLINSLCSQGAAMSELSIDGVLGEYKPEDYSVRILEVVLKAIPNSPAYVHYRSVEDAVRALNPNASAAQLAEARALANDRDLKDVLWMGSTLDTVDNGYAIFTGLKTVWNLFSGAGAKALENDDQQRNDAIIKALGIAYMVYHAYPGTLAQKVNAFRATGAGQTLAIYYGAADVALPFADNALVGGGNFISTTWNKYGAAQLSRLGGMMGGRSIDEAKSTLDGILQPLEQVAATASRYVQPIAATAKQYVPSVVSGADKVAGVVASGTDMLPVYKLLSARLAAESAARRALGMV
jgi:hypothetical protein